MSIIKQHVDIDVSHVTTSENPAFFHRRIWRPIPRVSFVAASPKKLGRLKEDTWHPLPTRVSFAARTSFLEDFFSFAWEVAVADLSPLKMFRHRFVLPDVFGFLGKIGGIREAICWALGGSFFGTFFLASGTSRDPDTNSKSTWKMDGWKTIFSFWVLGLFSGAMLVLGRVPVLESRNNFVPRKNALREKQILTIT